MPRNAVHATLLAILLAATVGSTACSGSPPGTGTWFKLEPELPASRAEAKPGASRAVQATAACPDGFSRREDAPTTTLELASRLPAGRATRLEFQSWRREGRVPGSDRVYYLDGTPFSVLITPGTAFSIADGDARDGSAAIRLPGTVQVFLTLEGKPGGTVGFADPFYFLAGTLSRSTAKPLVWHLGTRDGALPGKLGTYRWDLSAIGAQPGLTALLYPGDTSADAPPLPPAIEALAGPDEVAPGQTAEIQATVSGAGLTYRWSASGGSISGESLATWQAPRPAGTYEIGLAAETPYYRTDTCALAVRVPNVCPAGTLTGAAGGPLPPTIEAGKTLALAAAGTDENGDALSITWEASSGAFSSGTGATTTWTAPQAEGPATLTAIVSDGICQTPVAWVVQVKDDANPTTFAYTSPINFLRQQGAAAATSTHVYLAGGLSYDSTGPVYEVEYAPIAADGSLGAWQVTSRLNVARYALSAFIAHGYFFVAGGYTMRTTYPYNAIDLAPQLERALIMPDGSLGAFEVLTGTQVTHSGANAVVSGGEVYLIGGGRQPAPYLAPERAGIGSDGSIGPFQVLRDLSPAVYYPTGTMVGQTLVTVGGHQIASLALADRPVRWARLLPTGDLEPWRSALLVHPRHFGMAHSHGKHVYAIGGRDPERIEGTNGPIAVEQAAVDDTGALGAFANVPGVVLNIPRYLAAGVSAGKRFYAIGGRSMADNRFPETRTVEYARLP